MTTCHIRDAHLFFSPCMERISIDLSCVRNDPKSRRRNILPAVASIMSAFPTTTLQCIHVDDWRIDPWVDFADSLSSTVCVVDHRSQSSPPQFHCQTRW